MRYLLLVLLSCLCLHVQAESIPPLKGEWQLVLNEEFNSFNQDVWSFGDSWQDVLPPEPAMNFFSAENINFQDGRLILEIKKQDLSCCKLTDKAQAKVRNYKFSTGAVNSFGKFKFLYGYIEAAIKLPQAKGLWSAFWLMPDRGLDVENYDRANLKELRSTEYIKESETIVVGKGMEIDIMEQLSEWDQQKFSYAIHWDGYQEKKKSFEGRYFLKDKKKNDFVRFGLYWAPDKLVWFANGKKVAENNSKRIADVPMYIILNNFVGGWATPRKEYHGFPEQMEIDYLRIWQRPKPETKL